MDEKNYNFYYKNNRFQQLRGFYYTAKLGNLSKAAEALNLTQPAISLQIKSLERDLEIILLKRNGPNFSLTKEGNILLAMIIPIIEGINNLKTNFNTLIASNDDTSLTIASNQASILYLLPKFVSKYLSTYPERKLNLHAAIALDGIEKLRTGEVDIIVGPPSFEIPNDCIYYPIFYYDPVLITGPNHPLAGKENLSIAEISKYDLILPPAHLRTIKTIDEVFAQHNYIPSDTRLKFKDWEIIKKYVELGMVITIALSIAIQDDPVLVGTKLNHYFPRSSYGIILKRGQIIPKKVQDLIELMAPDFKNLNYSRLRKN